ncbi:hypothetical protein D3C78_1565740 [compost metagenome]
MRRRAKPGGGDAGPGEQAFIPVIRVNVDQLGGGGVGVFPIHVAGQAIAEVVRDQQRVSDVFNQLWLLFRQRTQLIQRVER